MTDLRKAAEMALEVFGGSDWGEEPFDSSWTDKANATVEELRQALAQPEQEPIGWITEGGKGEFGWRKTTDKDIPLYTAPPKREWVGYTNEDRERIVPVLVQSLLNHDEKTMAMLLKAILIDIELQLKEKNT